MKIINLLLGAFVILVQVAQTQGSDTMQLTEDFVEIETVGVPKVVAGNLVIRLPEKIDFEKKKKAEIDKRQKADKEFKSEDYQPSQETFFDCFKLLNEEQMGDNKKEEPKHFKLEIWKEGSVVFTKKPISDRNLLIREKSLVFYIDDFLLQKTLEEGIYSFSLEATITDKDCVANAEGDEKTKDSTPAKFQPIELELKKTEFTIFDVRVDGDSIVLRVDSLDPEHYKAILENCSNSSGGNSADECKKSQIILELLNELQTAIPRQERLIDTGTKSAFRIEPLYENHLIDACTGGLIEFTPSLYKADVYRQIIQEVFASTASSADFGNDGKSRPSIAKVAVSNLERANKSGAGNSSEESRSSSENGSGESSSGSGGEISCDPSLDTQSDNCGLSSNDQQNVIEENSYFSVSPGDKAQVIENYRERLGVEEDFLYSGDGTIIAVLDTPVSKGLFNSFEQLDSIDLLEGKNFVDDYSLAEDCKVGDCVRFRQINNLFVEDIYLHGTSVALLVAGGTPEKPIGIAPSAEILPVGVCDSLQICSLTNLILGVCYATKEAANSNQEKNHVVDDKLLNNLIINLSLSKAEIRFSGPLLKTIFKDATSRGAIIVVSAGDVNNVSDVCESDFGKALKENEKNDSDVKKYSDIEEEYNECVRGHSNANFYPAALTSSIGGVVTVGAMALENNQVSKWKYDPAVTYTDIHAPGKVKLPIKNLLTCNEELPEICNGTSFATALISGVAAVLRQKYPNASAEDIEILLTGGEEDIGSLLSSTKSFEEIVTIVNSNQNIMSLEYLGLREDSSVLEPEEGCSYENYLYIEDCLIFPDLRKILKQNSDGDKSDDNKEEMFLE
jgi:subtilisin family serine protease